MRMIFVLLFVLVASVPSLAQTPTATVLPSGQAVTVAWDAPASSGPENAPVSYRFETFAETAAGVVITTTNVPLTPTQATLPATALPTSDRFLLAVRAVGTTGIVSERSNALPFVRPGTPGTPVNLRVVLTP